MHREAARICRDAYDVAFGLIAERVRRDGSLMETEVQKAILGHFASHGLVTDGPPIVGVGPHSGDPHYETTPETDAPIQEGDFVLVDLWAKVNQPRAVYADYTRVGFVGKTVPAKYEDLFHVVVEARDAGIARVKEAFAAGRPLRGQEVDDAVRRVIEAAGHGKSFNHRTGHNIGQDDHGNGAHLDNLETRDDRLILRRTCFSIEPGIYLPEFGVRTEVDVFIDAEGIVHVTGGEPQTCVLPILA
jgi:Xaa-Pro aminopeptidase